MKRTLSLNENHMFRRLYKAGKSHVTPCAAVYIRRNGKNCNRLGITATKKIGNAVERNRARRLLKEAYRLMEPELPMGFDIVLVARKKTVYVKMQAVQAAIRPILTGMAAPAKEKKK